MTNVLIIDADKSLRSQTIYAFEKYDFTVNQATSAQTAIASCEDHRPDVIVLELQLRGHSGVEFIHELRSYPEWQDIPVVLYTLVPWANIERFAKSFESLGILGYAYKPETSYQKLINIVEDAAFLKQ